MTSDNQPTTPEPKKRLLPRPEVPSVQEQEYIDAVDASTRRMGKTTNAAAKLIEEHNLPTPADKVCPTCEGTGKEFGDRSEYEGSCPDCHGTGRIARTSTPDRSKDVYNPLSSALPNGHKYVNGVHQTDCPAEHSNPKDVQPVSPNGDELYNILLDLAYESVGRLPTYKHELIVNAQIAVNALIAQREQVAYERGECRVWNYIAQTPVTYMTITDLDADPTGDTSYEVPLYSPPKKYVDENVDRLTKDLK